MANETRKSKPAARAQQAAKAASVGPSGSPSMPPDPLSGDAFKALITRVGLILLALWVLAGMVAGFVQSSTTAWVVLGGAFLVTAVVVGVAIWAVRRTRRAQGVASILASVKSDDDRKRAMEELDKGYKADDPAAIFARAQLQMQDDPRVALTTLEQIPLTKVLASVADEARAQRALIHLMLSESTKARDLVDGIDFARHSDARTKAMMTSVTAEAWARTGQAKKAESLLALFNPEDPSFEQVRAQMWRARAFVAAYSNEPKDMRRALKKLLEIDLRLLGGFLNNKKIHPLLQKEAKQLVEQSGQVPRKMQFQRH